MSSRITMNANWWSVCPWCDRTINAGAVQELERTHEGLRWVHPDCAEKVRSEVESIAVGP